MTTDTDLNPIDGTGTISMTLYDINKSIMANEKPLAEEDLVSGIQLVFNWLNKIDTCYFMLLNHDRHSYTLFRASTKNYKALSAEIIDCLISFGALLSIEEESNGAIAIWLQDYRDNEINCYYLFDYTGGVIDIV